MKQTAKPRPSAALDAGIPSQAIGKYATNFNAERLRAKIEAACREIKELNRRPESPDRDYRIALLREQIRIDRRKGRELIGYSDERRQK